MKVVKFDLLIGPANIFGYSYCENDRLWRKMLAITPDRYQKALEYQFDECYNAFMKPKRPVYMASDLLANGLLKKADFGGEAPAAADSQEE